MDLRGDVRENEKKELIEMVYVTYGNRMHGIYVELGGKFGGTGEMFEADVVMYKGRYYLANETGRYWTTGGEVIELRNGYGKKVKEVSTNDVTYLDDFESEEYKKAIRILKRQQKRHWKK